MMSTLSKSGSSLINRALSYVKLSFIFASLFFVTILVSGCSAKPYVVKELFCFPQEVVNRPPETEIRVHKDDVTIAIKFKEEIDKRLDFYENQVNMNNKACEAMVSPNASK